MPSRKPATPPNGDTDTGGAPASTADSGAELTLLEQAEAEAARAEAEAVAARARAKAIRLRREAELAGAELAGSELAGSELAGSELAGADETVDADTAADTVDGPATPPIDGEATTVVGSAVPDAGVPRRRRMWPVMRWATGVLAVLAIGALVTASVMMIVHHRDVQAQQRRAAEFEAAARQGVVTLMSLDYNHAAEAVKRIIENSTGDFKKDFENESENFIKTAQESKAVTEASVTAAAVESMTENDAVVLLAATSKVTNAAGARQEPRNWRLVVNLTREADQIKVSKVEFVP